MLSLKGFSQVFSRGRSNDGREAKELLETVDDLLTQSNNLLGSISRRLPSKQFETFEYKYTELNLMVIDVKEDVREREQRRIFFENEAEKEAFQSDIRKLLQQCETYRNDVVTASRRVQMQGGVPSTSTTEVTGSSSQSELSLKPDNLPSPWVSIVADTTSQDEKSKPGVDYGELGSTKRFIATVAYDPRKDLAAGDSEVATSSQDGNSYFRILICGDKNKRAVVVDTKPHHPGDATTEAADSSQDDLLRVGDMLMRSDPQDLEGHQVVDSYRGPSFIASFISTFTYNTSNMLTGGML